MRRNLLLLSNSTMPGQETLQHAGEEIKQFLQRFSVSEILFIPYALKDYDAYTDKIRGAFKALGYAVKGIHNLGSPVDAVANAQAIFIGGGNTFRLLKTLYENNIVTTIRNRVLLDNVPYMGSSAGTNVATVNICTTNDMPIVYPPTFDALSLVPFNINPHYIDPDTSSKHMGETRQQRIEQYHEGFDTKPVVGLREGSLLLVNDNTIQLLGPLAARIFIQSEEPKEYPSKSDLSFLFNEHISLTVIKEKEKLY